MLKEISGKVVKQKKMSPTRQIALSFALVIFIGSLLLTLPVANKAAPTDYINHLFIATSATCVTGLIPYPPVEQYTLFGQLVILALIQIGGLGFLTFLALFYVKAKKRLSFTNKLVMQEAMNVTSLENLPKFLRNVVKYTFLFELIGAILLATQFVPDYGLIYGIYLGIFHSVSAFCNAGFDVIGAQSLIPYQTNVVVNLTICALIILGGLGFFVWFDIAKNLKLKDLPTRAVKHFHHFFELHSKIVLMMTTILLVSGTVLFYILEHDTVLKDLGFFDGLLVSFFQSTTLRTAGFATVDYSQLCTATKLFMCLFMFIGGSPAGTAGGVKTVPVAIIIATMKSVFKGESHIRMFERRIEDDVLKRVLTILLTSLTLVFIGAMILSITEDASFIDICFEVISAFGTVGLTIGITSDLTVIGKIIIILLMYAGRIGPITMILSFMRKSRKNTGHVVYPKGEIILG